MELEFKITNEFLSSKILWLRIIIHIISFKHKSLGLLKKVVNSKTSNKIWIQIVINAFSPSNSSLNWPSSLLLHFIQDNEGICLWKSIKIWNVNKTEWKLDSLLQSCFIRLTNSMLDGLESSIVYFRELSCYSTCSYGFGVHMLGLCTWVEDTTHFQF